MTNEQAFDSIEPMETIQASFDHPIRENPIGEARKDALRLDFDRRLKLEFHGTKVTSDAGLPAYRELDDALGLTSAIDLELRDIRTGKNTQHDIAACCLQGVAPRLSLMPSNEGAATAVCLYPVEGARFRLHREGHTTSGAPCVTPSSQST